MTTANGNPRQTFLSPPLTARYRPSVHDWGMSWYVTGQRPLFRYLDVPTMQRDPRIRFGLGILTGIMSIVRWSGQMTDATGQTRDIVEASSPEVKQWVEETLTRFWQRDMRRLARNNFKWGWSPGEVNWKEAGGLVRYDRVGIVEPPDAVPLETDLGFWGARVTRVEGSGIPLDLTFPRVFWLTNDEEGRFYKGRSSLEGAWEPWVEKRGKHGACDSRRGWYSKNAFSGGTMKHPVGFVEDENGIVRSNQDYAREIAERKENGGIMILPQGKDDNGVELWSYDEPKINGSLEGVREYIKDLDGEILEGMDIPNEVVTAAETGSGWSGRSIPMVFFLVGSDGRVLAVLHAVDICILRPGVWVNFGPEAWYKINPPSLLQLTKDSAEPQYPSAQSGGDSLGNAQQGFGRSAGGGLPSKGGQSGAALVPYTGARGGRGWKNPVTGRIEYQGGAYQKRLSLAEGQPEEVSGWPVVADAIRERVREEVARRFPKRPKKARQNFVAPEPVEQALQNGAARRAALHSKTVRMAVADEWKRENRPDDAGKLPAWRNTRTGELRRQATQPGSRSKKGQVPTEPAASQTPVSATPQSQEDILEQRHRVVIGGLAGEPVPFDEFDAAISSWQIPALKGLVNQLGLKPNISGKEGYLGALRRHFVEVQLGGGQTQQPKQPAQEEPAESPPPVSTQQQSTPDAILRAFANMETQNPGGQIYLAQLRKAAATQAGKPIDEQEFNKAVMNLRREKKLRIIAAGAGKDWHGEENWAGGIPGENEHFIMAERGQQYQDQDKPPTQPKAPEQSQTSATPQGGSQATHGHLLRSWNELDKAKGGHNFVSLVDLRRAHPELNRQQFDQLIDDLRRQGILTLSAAEGRHGITREEQEAAIQESPAPGSNFPGQALLYASIRPEAREQAKQMIAPATEQGSQPEVTTTQILDSLLVGGRIDNDDYKTLEGTGYPPEKIIESLIDAGRINEEEARKLAKGQDWGQPDNAPLTTEQILDSLLVGGRIDNDDYKTLQATGYPPGKIVSALVNAGRLSKEEAKKLVKGQEW